MDLKEDIINKINLIEDEKALNYIRIIIEDIIEDIEVIYKSKEE